jgi:hypothetical protein
MILTSSGPSGVSFSYDPTIGAYFVDGKPATAEEYKKVKYHAKRAELCFLAEQDSMLTLLHYSALCEVFNDVLTDNDISGANSKIIYNRFKRVIEKVLPN